MFAVRHIFHLEVDKGTFSYDGYEQILVYVFVDHCFSALGFILKELYLYGCSVRNSRVLIIFMDVYDFVFKFMFQFACI